MDGDAVEYEPASVKELLAEMKDTAELLVDLSYSAVLLGSAEVADPVLDLEQRMDVLQLRARMSLLLAARSPEDAEQLAPVLGIVGAAEKISDAAGDIAKVVLENVGVPEAMRAALPEAVDSVVRVTLQPGPLADETLQDLNLATETGVRVIALRRDGADDRPADGEWVFNPGPETRLLAGDTLLLRGSVDNLAAVYEDATGERYRPPPPPDSDVADLERAVDSIVLMKDMAELAVDLAYGAVLFESEALAEEVLALEAEVDALQSRFEAWTLRAAADHDDPVELRGLVHLGQATELVSDAAVEISEGVLRGLGTHPVIAEAVLESDEVIVRVTVADGADLAGTTLGGRRVGTETGMRVIGVRRPGDDGSDWVVSPGPETPLRAGDVLLAKGTRTGAGRLAALAGDEVDV